MRNGGYRGDDLTPILVVAILCFVVYLATIAGNFFDYDLIPMLGLQPATFLERPWTIVTNLFVHGNIWHILANMITLFFFGRFLASLVGTRSFYIIYFLGGIMGNVLFMLFAFIGFLTSPYSTVIGASGAVFALGGALTVLTPKLKVFVFPIPMPIPLWVAVIGGFFIMSSPNIAWQGHLGGLLTGLAAGAILRNRIRIVLR
jgi:membrane associated rhomboid family serine protease